MIVRARAEVGAAVWNRFVEQHQLGWFWHTTHWLDYCVAYWPGAEDLSFAVVDDAGDLVTLVPLIREGDAFTMGGHPGAEPLFHGGDATSHALVYDYMAQLAAGTGTTRWAVRSVPQPNPPPWLSEVSGGWTDISWTSHVLDLWAEERDLWRNLRRSYHSLIHRAQRDYSLIVVPHGWGVHTAHAIHAEAAGRETRAQRTWDLMAEWADAGYVLTALALSGSPDPPVRARGMALTIRYKDAAYYGSGATLDKDLSHALLWETTRALKAGGLKTFELGWGERPGDTDKDRTVSFFKQGFGGHRWHLLALERRYV